MEGGKVMAAILVMAAVTAAVRFLPFMVFGEGRKTPKAVEYLGSVLPYAIMGLLVVFCLKDTNFQSAGGFLPQLIASAVVIVSYVLKRNTLLSIISGTALYMLLVQTVF